MNITLFSPPSKHTFADPKPPIRYSKSRINKENVCTSRLLLKTESTLKMKPRIKTIRKGSQLLRSCILFLAKKKLAAGMWFTDDTRSVPALIYLIFPWIIYPAWKKTNKTQPNGLHGSGPSFPTSIEQARAWRRRRCPAAWGRKKEIKLQTAHFLGRELWDHIVPPPPAAAAAPLPPLPPFANIGPRPSDSTQWKRPVKQTHTRSNN